MDMAHGPTSQTSGPSTNIGPPKDCRPNRKTRRAQAAKRVDHIWSKIGPAQYRCECRTIRSEYAGLGPWYLPSNSSQWTRRRPKCTRKA